MERLSTLDPESLSPRQRDVYDKVAGTRGGVRGPFAVLLRCPEIADGVQALGAQLRFAGGLPGRLRELAILTTARFWTAQYEWAAHAPIAEKEGLDPAVIDAIAQWRKPVFDAAEEKAVYDFCHESLGRRRVGDDTYARALESLGEDGVVELAAVVGYYSLISTVLNAFEVAPRDGAVPLDGEPAGAAGDRP
ncbi:MAG: carboxymuconolactone decarboxylase family protein [Rhodospirillales bacterium]